MKCFCASTRRAARILTQLYEEEFRSFQLSAAQFELLGTILNRPNLGQSELAALLSIDQTTLSRNLKILISRKWIQRNIHSQDKRHASYRVLKPGRTVWHEALPGWKLAQQRLQKKLGEDWPSLLCAVERLITAAETAAKAETSTALV